MSQLNHLEHVSLRYCNLFSPIIDECMHLNLDAQGIINIPSTGTLRIDGYTITAADLRRKLQLLDRLIAEYLPEELI